MFPGFAIAGVLPALVLMMIVDRADAKRPEPRWSVRRVALAGAISIIPAAIIELLLMKVGPRAGIAHAVYEGFIVAAVVEETCKALCVRWFVWNRPEFDERTDGIVYGVRAGLGFAMVENVFYLLEAKSMVLLVVLFCARAILAVPMHAITGAFMGHAAAWKRFEGRGPGMLGGWVIAVLFHGTYDAALFDAKPYAEHGDYAVALALFLVPLFAVVGGGLAVLRMWRQALAADDVASMRAAALARA